MKKIKILSLILLFLATLTVTSCASNKKCNGKKGVKTPMGLM